MVNIFYDWHNSFFIYTNSCVNILFSHKVDKFLISVNPEQQWRRGEVATPLPPRPKKMYLWLITTILLPSSAQSPAPAGLSWFYSH